MIELSIDDADLTRMERALVTLHRDQMPFAISRALNDCAKAAVLDVNTAMAEVFDRPTPFTSRAAIAPRGLAATKSSLSAGVTLRPVQAEYLRLEETGGTRAPTASSRILLPGKSLPLNQFGNIPKSALRAFFLQAQASAGKARRSQGKAVDPTAASIAFLRAGDKGNKAKVSGLFRRLPGRHLARLTAFKKETSYKERLGYHARVEASVRAHWPAAILARLHEAIRSAR